MTLIEDKQYDYPTQTANLPNLHTRMTKTLTEQIMTDDKYFVISTTGTIQTHASEDAAVKAARGIVGRNDDAEVVVAKVIKNVHVDKPIIVEDIE